MNQRTLLLSQRALPMHQINHWMVANQNCSNGTSRRRCLTLWATRVSCCSTGPGRRERARSRAPELFLPIKAAVDEDPRPGRFLLTGSANVLLLPKLADSLAGRIEILTLWPFSQGELAGCGKTSSTTSSRTNSRPASQSENRGLPLYRAPGRAAFLTLAARLTRRLALELRGPGPRHGAAAEHTQALHGPAGNGFSGALSAGLVGEPWQAAG